MKNDDKYKNGLNKNAIPETLEIVDTLHTEGNETTSTVANRSSGNIYVKRLFCGGIVVAIITCIFLMVYMQTKKKEAFENCINTAEQICIENNVTVNNISIHFYQQYEDYKLYKIFVDGSTSNASMSDLYTLVEKIDSLSIDYDNFLLLSHIQINGKEYELDVLNNKILICNDKEVYKFVSEADKAMKEILKTKYPYEGLPEKYIGDTILGEPDEKEYSHDYFAMQERARWITYTWYDSEGTRKCEAKVSAWDGKNRQRVEPYVKYIDFGGELLYLNPQ